jgi:uncharacterized protein YuzE
MGQSGLICEKVSRMKIEYDPRSDTMYINLNNKPVSSTQSINDVVLVDLDENGHPVQIEILSASHYGDVSELMYKILSETVQGQSG